MDLTEDEGELQLITECWVEPQHGVSYDCSARKEFLEGLDYREISQSVRNQKKTIFDNQSNDWLNKRFESYSEQHSTEMSIRYQT